MARFIHNPHDRFLKSLLSDIEVAREYFSAFLPEAIKEVVDMSGLEHSPHSFISDDLKETQSDMVFRCPLLKKYGDREVFLCLLVEHRSTTYKYVSIQQGGYIFDAYRQQLKNREDPLIPVLPFLYYHGSEKWLPPNIHDLFDWTPSPVREYIPLFRFLFVNIQNYNDDQIRQLGNNLMTSALLTQKYSGRPDLLLDRFRQIFTILTSWDRRNLLTSLIVYYLELVEVEPDQLTILTDQIPESMKTEFVSLADRLREEGMEKGLEKGMEKGEERKSWFAAENMLRKGFELSIICDVLDVTQSFVEKVRKAMNERD